MSGLFRLPDPRLVTLASCSSIIGLKNSAQLAQCKKEPQEQSSLHLYSPLSPIRIFRPNPHLEIAFDQRTKNPVYVLERLNADVSFAGKRPRHHFYESQVLPEMFRSRNSSFHKSGYDRGHLAAAANYSTQSTIVDTYNLCNVSPQDPRLNATVWARLEDWTRRVARVYRERHDCDCDTYVVTGPLWLPVRAWPDKRMMEYQYPAIGVPPNLVAVPTHFFKLIVVVRRPSPSSTNNDKDKDNNAHSTYTSCRIAAYACFVMPNRNVLESDRNWILEDGLVRWTDLESVTGLEFFTNLADREWKQRADDALVVARRRTRPNQQLLNHDQQPQEATLLLLLPSGGKDDDAAAVANQKNQQLAETNAAASPQSPPGVSHLCPNGSCPRY